VVNKKRRRPHSEKDVLEEGEYEERGYRTLQWEVDKPRLGVYNLKGVQHSKDQSHRVEDRIWR